MRIWRLTTLFWNIVKRSRVQWMRKVIVKCESEHAAQGFCKRKADSTMFQKRFVGTEPTVQCFSSVLYAPSRLYSVLEALCRHRADSTVFSKRFVSPEPIVQCLRSVL